MRADHYVNLCMQFVEAPNTASVCDLLSLTKRIKQKKKGN